MIYIIDEDEIAYRAWHAELKMRGLHVHALPDAATAFDTLWNAPPQDVQLVLIDVMLAAGHQQDYIEENRRMPTAGLRLLRDLTQQNPAVFPQKAVLFTNAIGDTLDEAIACSQQHGVPLWDKRSFISPIQFGDRVRDQLKQSRP